MGSNSRTNSMVIVAIPDENDRVWKVSSEKTPHLTLLFLGDADQVANPESIVQFVEHAADRSLNRFYLPVDRRDELGADQADVLFFKKGRYDFKAVRDFRALLLKDDNIKTAYDSTSQHEFPEHVGAAGHPWIPHLTLGYPDAPAKPMPDDWETSFYSVEFTKIAVWMGNYEGPEFPLKDYWDEMDDFPMDAPVFAAMSSLQHLSEEPWSNFTKADYTVEQWHTSCLIHTHDGAPTSKNECKLPVKTPDGALNRNGVHAAAAALAGARGGLKGVSADQKTKAANALKRYYAQLDETPPDSLTQSIDLVSEFMSHHGVKGQKWGVRKVEGGGQNAHININTKTGQAQVSDASLAAIVVPAVVAFPLASLAFLSPRVRAEVSAARAVNKGVQADKKWQKQIDKSKRGVEVHNTAADEINQKIPAFNKDNRWKNIDLTKDPIKMKEYNNAVEEELLNPAYSRAAVKVYGEKSPTGRFKFEIKDPSTGILKVKDLGVDVEGVRHAAEDGEMSVQFKIVRDDNGLIIGFRPEDEDISMAQTMDLGLEFMSHHGVKGMRWGVRKSATTPASVDIGNRVTFGPGVAAQRIVGAAKKVGGAAKKVGGAISRWHANLADSAWERSIYSDNAQETVHNHVAENIDHHIDKLARSPKYREKNLRTDSDLQKSYYQDVAKVTDVAYRKAVKDVYGQNYTGTKTARYVADPRGPRIEIRNKKTGDLDTSTPLSSMHEIKKRRADREAESQKLRDQAANDDFVRRTLGEHPVRHADMADAPDISIKLKLDDNGQISGVTFVEMSEDNSMAQAAITSDEEVEVDTMDDELTQTMNLGMEFLEHHGVKGMKWGVRRDPNQAGFLETRRVVAENKTREKRTAIDPRVQDTIGSSKRKKTKIDAKGGEDHPASPDALRVAAAQQKLKKSGVNALSNKELQDLNQRLNLEMQVSTLMGKKPKSLGAQFVSKRRADFENQLVNNPTAIYRKTKGVGKTAAKSGRMILKARKLAGSPV